MFCGAIPKMIGKSKSRSLLETRTVIFFFRKVLLQSLFKGFMRPHGKPVLELVSHRLHSRLIDKQGLSLKNLLNNKSAIFVSSSNSEPGRKRWCLGVFIWCDWSFFKFQSIQF